MAFHYKLGKSFHDVCRNLSINDRDRELIWRITVEEEGYTELALCFVAAKCSEKLKSFVGDTRFASVFINEVRKNALKPNDPRWNKRNRSYWT